MKVADAMTPRSEVVTVEIPGTRDDVLEYLQERKFSSVPVIKHEGGAEQFRGLVTRERLIEEPNEDQLALLLDEGPTTTQDTEIEALAELMVENDARRVPVVDGELEGIITVTDVIRAIARGDVDAEFEVGEYADRHINTTYRLTPLSVVAEELFYADEPYAVCLDDDGEMCGIVTEVDILDVAEVVQGEAETGDSIAGQDDDWMWEGIKAVGSRRLPTRDVEFEAGPVEQFMTDDLVTVSRSHTAIEAARLMIEHDVEQLPMVAGADLAGMVYDMHLLEGLYE